MTKQPSIISLEKLSSAKARAGIVFFLWVAALFFLFITRIHTRVTPMPEAALSSPIILTDPVTGIHTYQSEAGHFDVQYPPDYVIHVNQAYMASTQSFGSVDNLIELDAPKHNTPYLLIQFSYLAGPTSLHDFVLNSVECEDIEEGTGLPLKVGEIDALAYLNFSCNLPSETRIYFMHGEMGYTININQEKVTKSDVVTLLQNIHFR